MAIADSVRARGPWRIPQARVPHHDHDALPRAHRARGDQRRVGRAARPALLALPRARREGRSLRRALGHTAGDGHSVTSSLEARMTHRSSVFRFVSAVCCGTLIALPLQDGYVSLAAPDAATTLANSLRALQDGENSRAARSLGSEIRRSAARQRSSAHVRVGARPHVLDPVSRHPARARRRAHGSAGRQPRSRAAARDDVEG